MPAWSKIGCPAGATMASGERTRDLREGASGKREKAGAGCAGVMCACVEDVVAFTYVEHDNFVRPPLFGGRVGPALKALACTRVVLACSRSLCQHDGDSRWPLLPPLDSVVNCVHVQMYFPNRGLDNVILGRIPPFVR